MSFKEQNQNYNNQELQDIILIIKKNIPTLSVILIILFLFIAIKSTYYTVAPDEEALILRLGKYIKTSEPGLHFKVPFGIDQNINVKVKRILQEEFGFRTRDVSTRRTTYSNSGYDEESLMLTGDLNVAIVEWVVQYQISDPFKFLFQTSSPIQNIRDIAESIMRRVVGDQSVTEVLTTGRVKIALNTKILMQQVLDKYNMGVRVVGVKLQDVNPPNKVKSSFNEVNEAKQEQEQMINRAEEEYNKVIPKARGKAARQISEAKGYSMAIINRAKGQVASFTAMQKEYKLSPNITKKRMYIEAMQNLFKNSKNLILVDPKIKGLLPIFSKGTLNE